MFLLNNYSYEIHRNDSNRIYNANYIATVVLAIDQKQQFYI